MRDNSMRTVHLNLLTLSTESNALTPETFRLSVISSRGFCTSLIALLLMGSAYLNSAPGSLMGGPEINTERSGSAGPTWEAYAGQPNVGKPVVTNPIANAIESAHFLKEKEFSFF